MRSDLEKLNDELIQAQLLLGGQHCQFGELLQEIGRRKLLHKPEIQYGPVDPATGRMAENHLDHNDIPEHEVQLRRMLHRLDKLG